MPVIVKAPQVYKPAPSRVAAPAAYKTKPAQNSSAQLKPANLSQNKSRTAAPPAYRPQQAGMASQPKVQAPTIQPQSQYELSSPVWVGSGRQQIRVIAKGSPTPVGTVDVHYNNGKAFISDLEVVQGHRRHGVGTMLMKAAMDSARRNGSSATELEARPGAGSISNQALVGMYQKLGFKSAGVSRRGNPKLSTR